VRLKNVEPRGVTLPAFRAGLSQYFRSPVSHQRGAILIVNIYRRDTMGGMSMPTINTSQYVTTAQAAIVLGVTPIRVRQFCQEGRLDALEVAGRWLIPADKLRQFARIDRPVGRRLS